MSRNQHRTVPAAEPDTKKERPTGFLVGKLLLVLDRDRRVVRTGTIVAGLVDGNYAVSWEGEEGALTIHPLSELVAPGLDPAGATTRIFESPADLEHWVASRA